MHPGKIRYALLISCLLCLLALLTGCVTLVDPEVSQEYEKDVIGTIAGSDQVIGQTFVSRRSHLNSVYLWARRIGGQTQSDSPSTEFDKSLLTVEIYHSPDEWKNESPPLETVHLANLQSQPVQVTFNHLSDLPGQGYFILLKSPNGTYEVYGRQEDVYPHGEAYIGNQPIEADLAFRTTYEYGGWSILEDAQSFLSHAWYLIPLVVFLFLPGLLILEAFGIRTSFDGGEKVALSLGISLGLIPLVLLWTSTLNLKWNRTTILLVAGVLVATSIFLVSRNKIRLKITGIDIALAGIFLLSFGIRLAMVRDLAAPPWVDSVHHGLITRLIMENGAFPDTYLPYLDLAPTKYHAGFHSILATFLWFTGLEIPQGMLWLGQVLNALVIFPVYLLTTTLTRDRVAGLFAALVSGLLTPMPAYYTSWGRYTQLTGLLILPCVMALLKLCVDLPGKKPPSSIAAKEKRDAIRVLFSQAAMLLPAIIASTGLFLIHYRAAVFTAGLVMAYFISYIPFRRDQLKPYARNVFFSGSITLTGVILFTLPWTWPDLTQNVAAITNTARTTASRFLSGFSGNFLTAARGEIALLLSGLGIIWGIIQNRRFILTIFLWVVFLLFTANLGTFGLPGGWLINNNSVEIMLFMPVSVLAGYGIGQTAAKLETILKGQWKILAKVTATIAGTALAVVGIASLLPILNHGTDLARESDLSAVEWIAENIPEGETFLLNSFSWGYGLSAGNDGGYWISALTHHNTMPPPVLYGFGPRDERQAINRTIQDFLSRVNNAVELRKYLLTEGIRYIYIGPRGRSLSAKSLIDSQQFKPVYAKDGVWILEALPGN